MAEEIKVKITKRETITPSSQTPQNLQTLKLSLLDQISPFTYVPLVLFYTNNNNSETASDRTRRLKETLPKALDIFYPFAGRQRDNLFIECNDKGAEFFEAKSVCSISEILLKPDLNMLKKLLPVEPESTESSAGGSLLLVQATTFVCGGLALGLSFSHKIADAATVGVFVQTWAKITRGESIATTMQPLFSKAVELFPPVADFSNPTSIHSVELVQENCVTRRYVFEGKRIEDLKKRSASSETAKTPTRVEAVSALLWRVATKSGPTTPKKSVWSHAVNLRKRVSPPMREEEVGNIIGGFFAKAYPNNDGDFKLGTLAHELRKGIEELSESYSMNSSGGYLGVIHKMFEEYTNLTKEGNGGSSECYTCSSWCRLGLYEADFGWEKPRWVSVVSMMFKDWVVLVDSSDGDGIEAWMTMREHDVSSFESNEELLAFAILNPSVVM